MDDTKKCIDCRTEPATKDAGKSGNPGTLFCKACWRAEFTDPAGER